MSNLNPNTIENVSIKQVKEIDEFLKIYHTKTGAGEQVKAEVLKDYMGRLSSESYDELIQKAQGYTMNGEIPTEQEWGQVRAIYREIGNEKIAKCKQRLEVASKNYSGTTCIADKVYGNITPKQAELNVLHAERNFAVAKRLRSIISIICGLAGFILITLFSNFITDFFMLNASNMILQLFAGVLSLVGLIVGAGLGFVLTNILVKAKKRDREESLVTKNANIELITKLQTEIKSAEENVRRIEDQYGVEILAQTDFSSLAPKKLVKQKVKKETKKVESKSKTEDKNTVNEEQKIENKSDESQSKEENKESLVGEKKLKQQKAPSTKKRVKQNKTSAEKPLN